jgi:hypothetical protein
MWVTPATKVNFQMKKAADKPPHRRSPKVLSVKYSTLTSTASQAILSQVISQGGPAFQGGDSRWLEKTIGGTMRAS